MQVPNGFTEKDELVWTLTTHGKTEKAYASLRPDYIVDDVVKASETGALGAGTSSPEVRAQQAAGGQDRRGQKPERESRAAVHAGLRGQGRRHSEAAQSGARGRGAGPGRRAIDGNRRDPGAAPTLRRGGRAAAAATPPRNPAMFPPTRITVGKNLGLHVSWFLYRGPGPVTFEPAADQGVGGHARRRQLAMGAAVVRADAAA